MKLFTLFTRGTTFSPGWDQMCVFSFKKSYHIVYTGNWFSVSAVPVSTWWHMGLNLCWLLSRESGIIWLSPLILFLTENIGHFLIFYFSAHNLFRLIECRDFNMNALKGIIFYFSCGLHAYSLNREAKYFEFTQFLVDGAHWQGQKKT